MYKTHCYWNKRSGPYIGDNGFVFPHEYAYEGWGT